MDISGLLDDDPGSIRGAWGEVQSSLGWEETSSSISCTSRRRNAVRGSLNTVGKTVSTKDFAHRSDPMMMDIEVIKSSVEKRLTQNKVLDEFTINKLQFPRIGLVGRDQEKSLLEQRLLKLISSLEERRQSSSSDDVAGNCEFLMISGESGCGKSALALSLQETLRRKNRGVFVRGKFDQMASDQPYATIVAACHDLGVHIQNLRADNGDCDMQATLHKEFIGMEAQLLTQAVPILAPIFGFGNECAESREHNVITKESYDQSQQMLESGFRKFFQAVSVYFAPLVLALDDLQWADIGTIELLKGLLSDTNNHMMIVGCHRSNDVDESQKLTKMLQDLKEVNVSSLHITEIRLGNLGCADTNQILMTLLNVDKPTETQTLADLCQQRTNGNPFFLLLYLEMLHRCNLLTFNMGTFSWQWDVSVIKAKTGATANVVDLLQSKILKCGDELIHLLKLSCCLGNVFSAKLLFMVWSLSPEVMRDFSDSAKDVAFVQLLDDAVTENFLERCDEGLRWVHDKVQECASLLESVDDMAIRKHEAGLTLYSCFDDDEMDENIFCVANLLNAGKSSRSMDIAEINLRAAHKAKAFNALAVLTCYAQAGVDNLPPDCWHSCKDLALGLYTIWAQAASSVGDVKTMAKLCETVFNQKECSVLDTIPLYTLWIDNYRRNGNTNVAMKHTIEVLGKLGCRLPTNVVSQSILAVTTLIQLKQLIKKTPTIEKFLELPLMTDPVKKNVMALLAKMAYYAYLSQKKIPWLMATLKMVKMTFQHGLADESQLALSSYGIIMMHILGDWETGTHYVQLSLKLHEKLEEKSYRPPTICIGHVTVLGWMQPLQSQQRYLMEGYRVALELGDTQWAYANVLAYVEIGLCTGRPLHSIVEDIRIYATQFEAMNTNVEYDFRARMVWQLALNLMGDSDNTSVLCGAALEGEFVIQEVNPESALHDFLLVQKGFLCVYFGQHEQGANLAIARGNRVIKKSPGHAWAQIDPFLRGVSLYAMARKTNKRKYKRHAKSARAILKLWAKKGNPNVYHRLELLNAERAALTRNKETSELYFNAGRSAIRGGFIQDAALASERHAEYLMEMKDYSGAALRLEEAIDRYSVWGAEKKASQLRMMYSDLLSSNKN